MHPLLAELVAPFERMPEASAAELLATAWGVTPLSLARLDTERDDTFRFDTVVGSFVLKVAHPGDDPAVIDLQLAALAHAAAADPGLPLQRVLPAADGALSVVAGGRVARVYEWMTGTLARGSVMTPRELGAAGVMLGRVNLALRDFRHGASARELAWDLQRLPILRKLAADQAAINQLDEFEANVLPVLATLPHQVVHNDFHPGNLLVDATADEYIVGILDFGDTVHTARVNDLAIAVSYLPADAAPAFIAGFESLVPLLPTERELLPELTAARNLQRTLLNALLERDASANGVAPTGS